MKSSFRTLALALSSSALFAGAASAAETYTVDNSHTAVLFFADHFGFSKVVGRFLQTSGEFVIDEANPANSKINLELKVDSLTTNDGKRDEHLKGPDFFNAKQFPTATFVSTSVKKSGDSFDVGGDLTIHGVKKAVTVKVKQNKKGQDPWGTTRTGFDGEIALNRNDFGVSGVPPIPADIKLWFSVEGALKK
jgi:polyisoprenoid-binding protein YceI